MEDHTARLGFPSLPKLRRERRHALDRARLWTLDKQFFENLKDISSYKIGELLECFMLLSALARPSQRQKQMRNFPGLRLISEMPIYDDNAKKTV